MHSVINERFPDYTATRLQGGDINEVFLLISGDQRKVVKINSASDFPEMFRKESEGLNLLSDTFQTPKVYEFNLHKSFQYLLLEFFEEKPKNEMFWPDFARKLAETHQKTNISFGFRESNFIGSLVQNNNFHDSWEDFLIEERLAPMIEMAVNSGEVNYVESKIIEGFYKKINEIYPVERPSLLHGDLWAGNYLSTSEGPVLIDPAVYYGHREMDLGMMHLFGGFDKKLFDHYHELYPLEQGWRNRITINQLYPLLVHLNLFGRSYWEQVQHILKPFS